MAKDTSIRELGRTQLKLRTDLLFTPRTFGGESCYTIEDPVNSKFYRVGIPEYTFISLLDGHTSINQVLALSARAQPDAALTEQEAAAICKWLVEAELAATAESSQPARLAETAEKSARTRRRRFCNPAVIRLPIFHPDHFFRAVTPWISWLYSPLALAAWLILVVAATYEVVAHWDQFTASSRGVFAPDNWLWLGLCWIVLKLLHESSHGVVCKRYGGTVREAGVMFIMTAPVAYVDVTSSWRFRSKWQRIFTAAAGIYIELFLAAIATFVWSNADPGPLKVMCFNAILMASFTTILFNANPLMKYDGYYVLSDLLEIPNLYASGQLYLQHWARRYLLGVDGTPPRSSGAKRWAIQIYGVASLLWRVVFSIGLMLVATTFFHGAGIVLSCIAGAMWLGWPLIRFGKYLVWGTETETPNRVRFFCTAGLGSAALIFGLVTLPWPGAMQVPVVVEYSPLMAVRTGCAGFVRRVAVRPGERVGEGQIIAELENDQLAADLFDLVLAQQQSQLKLRAHETKGHMAAYQAELEGLKALEKKHDEKQLEVDQLTLRAPCAGTIIGRNLETWLGRYAKAGTEILSIGNESMLELRLSIAQDDVHAFAASLETLIRVRLPGTPAFACPLTRVNPRASIDLPYASLASVNGGPLAVRQKERGTSGNDGSQSPTDPFELLSPRFTGILTPSSDRSRSLYAGQLGVATLRPFNESIAKHLYRSVARWTENKLNKPQTVER
jgi:putative peptide zinc metalloprotease protein